MMTTHTKKSTKHKSAMENKQHSGGSGFNLFFLGILIGVIITLLLTTKKGRRILEILIDEGVEKMTKWEDVMAVIEKNSKKIVEKAEKLSDGVSEKAVEAQVVTQEVKHTVQERAKEVVREVEEKREELQEKVEERVAQAVEEIEQIKEEAREKVEEISQTIVEQAKEKLVDEVKVEEIHTESVPVAGQETEIEEKVEKIELRTEPKVKVEKTKKAISKVKEEKPPSSGRRFFRGIGRKK